MGHSYEGDFEDRTNGLYFPPGTSEYQSSARVSRRNMRADSHGPWSILVASKIKSILPRP